MHEDFVFVMIFLKGLFLQVARPSFDGFEHEPVVGWQRNVYA